MSVFRISNVLLLNLVYFSRTDVSTLRFYVAVNRNVDPLNVDAITDIKRTIKDRLER